MKIAILGGNGRMGGWMAPWLRKEHEVLILGRSVTPGKDAAAVDAMDQRGLGDALDGCDVLLHLVASIPRGADQIADPECISSCWGINVGSVAVSMLAAHAAGITRFLHMSTLGVHADAGQLLLEPAAAPDALHPYGLSKRAAEATCAMLADQLGMHAVSIRVGWPTSDDLAPAWLNPSTGEPVLVQRPDGGTIPAISGRDVASWILQELRNPARPGHRSVPLVADASTVFEAPARH